MSPVTSKRQYVGAMDHSSRLALVEEIKPLYMWFSPDSTDLDILIRLTYMPNATCTTLTEDGRCVGFMISHIEKHKKSLVLYVKGVIVDELYRSRHYFRKMLEDAIELYQPNYIALTTQNPRVYTMLAKICGVENVYPRHTYPPGYEILDLARQLISGGATSGEVGDTEIRNLVLKGHYTSSRPEDKTYMSSDMTNVDGFFDSQLGPTDGFLVIARFITPGR